jgi:hypothetical protein
MFFLDPRPPRISAAKYFRSPASRLPSLVFRLVPKRARCRLLKLPSLRGCGVMRNTGGIMTPERGVAAASADGVVLSLLSNT